MFSDDQKVLNKILFEYLVKLKMSLPDGKNAQECCYWCINEAVSGKDIVEAFKFYLEGKLSVTFESSKQMFEPETKIYVTYHIIKIKFDYRRS